MANTITTGKIYIDSTGLVTDQAIKIAYILFTPSSSNDKIVLRETSSGNDVLMLQAATAKQTLMFDTSRIPMVFTNGLYVQTISSGAVATIVLTNRGG